MSVNHISCTAFNTNQSTQVLIIPKHQLLKPGIDVGKVYFQLTLGRAGVSKYHLETFWATIRAFSSFGTLIVVTFTAARGNTVDLYLYNSC